MSNRGTLQAAAIAALCLTGGEAIAALTERDASGKKGDAMMLAQATDHSGVVGMWVTSDGHIRLELLPNGRYDEARGERRSVYKGRYVVRGSEIDFFDDSGFSVVGRIVDGVLSAGPDRFRKE